MLHIDRCESRHGSHGSRLNKSGAVVWSKLTVPYDRAIYNHGALNAQGAEPQLLRMCTDCRPPLSKVGTAKKQEERQNAAQQQVLEDAFQQVCESRPKQHTPELAPFPTCPLKRERRVPTQGSTQHVQEEELQGEEHGGGGAEIAEIAEISSRPEQLRRTARCGRCVETKKRLSRHLFG